MRSLSVLIAVMAMFSVVPAFAAKEKPKAEPTPFSKINEEFEKAGPAKIDDVDGYYSGRCYEASAKTQILPGLLAFVDYGAGPAYPELTERYVYRFSKYMVPDTFELPMTDETKKNLVKSISSYPATSYLSPAKEQQTGIAYAEFFSNTLSPALEVQIRKTGNVFFAQTKVVAGVELDSRVLNKRVEFEKGTVVEICYYFKRVFSKAEIDQLR